MEELDLSPYYMSVIAIGIASVALIVVLRLYMRLKKRNQLTPPLERAEAQPQAVELTTKAYEKILDEVRQIHTEFESRFGAKFSNHVFTVDDAFDFFYAVSNSIDRFEDGLSIVREDMDIDPIREAQGYVAIVQLIISWAQANGNDGIRAKAEECLDAAKSALEKAKAA